MKIINETFDVLVAGGGTAGHVAAIQAGRAGVKAVIIEAGTMLGGTMTSGGVYMPNHYYSPNGPVVLGIAWELYKASMEIEGLPIPDYRKRRPVENPGYYSYINVPIYSALAEAAAIKAGVLLHYHEFIGEVKANGNEWEVTSYGRGVKRITRAKEIIDCTGDSDVARALGLGVLKAPERQPGAYQYKIEGIDYEQIWDEEVQIMYKEAMADGTLKKGDYGYLDSLPFKYYLNHGGHNGTHVYDADTSTADGQTKVNIEGRERMLRMYKFVRNSIPGCERSVLKYMAPHGLARETYRIEGEYIITKEDFLSAVSFEDKVCNAFNYIDMHNPQTGCDVFFHESSDMVPTVPFRALIPKGSSRITVAGRIVSADRISLAGIRAQCTCMAMGQAMGAAAALGIKKGVPSREISTKNIVAMTVEHGAVPLK
jgi:hypothetical protein